MSIPAECQLPIDGHITGYPSNVLSTQDKVKSWIFQKTKNPKLANFGAYGLSSRLSRPT